ncbi:unnamed protein product (mitochondrion) [Plasmodiophora brassicae]|uniref:Uncharacterized protein n=1 Tax=Plasmodiophora brassicae TaxID=37360 RepID=A0A3P3YA20_PLABS|nr:unnamed protein product [Plasmodiophora brassicae]
MLSDIDHSCSLKASSVMKPAPGTAICQEIMAWGITVVRMCRVCADSFAFSGSAGTSLQIALVVAARAKRRVVVAMLQVLGTVLCGAGRAVRVALVMHVVDLWFIPGVVGLAWLQ